MFPVELHHVSRREDRIERGAEGRVRRGIKLGGDDVPAFADQLRKAGVSTLVEEFGVVVDLPQILVATDNPARLRPDRDVVGIHDCRAFVHLRDDRLVRIFVDDLAVEKFEMMCLASGCGRRCEVGCHSEAFSNPGICP